MLEASWWCPLKFADRPWWYCGWEIRASSSSLKKIGIDHVEQHENPEAIEEHYYAANCPGMPPQDAVEMLVTHFHASLRQHIPSSAWFKARSLQRRWRKRGRKGAPGPSERCKRSLCERAAGEEQWFPSEKNRPERWLVALARSPQDGWIATAGTP